VVISVGAKAALAQARRYLGNLEGVGSVPPDPTILLRPMAAREVIQSSALEGTYATPKELLLFELQPDEFVLMAV
jgi:hypothetical protein